jgi:hypothetical protein
MQGRTQARLRQSKTFTTGESIHVRSPPDSDLESPYFTPHATAAGAVVCQSASLLSPTAVFLLSFDRFLQPIPYLPGALATRLPVHSPKFLA